MDRRILDFNNKAGRVFMAIDELVAMNWLFVVKTSILNENFLEIPTEVVMKWTGQEDFKNIKP